jgi:hypothetical protein
MKMFVMGSALMVAFVLSMAGCANQPAASTTTDSTANPTDRRYDRTDIQRTGRGSTSEAIQALDPSTR